MTRVLICGGGIGGIATALAIDRNGAETVVLERAPRLEETGAGIQITPNASAALADLGVLEALMAHSFEPAALDIVDGCRGETLVSVGLKPAAVRRYGRPYLNVHRADLQDVLVEALIRRVPECLQLGAEVVGIEHDSDSVRVQLADGRELAGDALIAADGLHSPVRDALLGVERPRFTGHVAYRMLVPRAAFGEAEAPPPTVALSLGPHGHVVTYWVRGGELLNVVAIIESDWREDGWVIPAEVEELRGAFRAWDPALHRIFDAALDVHKWALLDRAVPDRWAFGRVALLGDACHAMLPYLAQGAAMAIEDAIVISDALAADADVANALRSYEAARMERVRRVHAQSTANASNYHNGSITQAMRDAMLRSADQRGSDAFLSQFDWLYGHTATRSPA
jgi:2-polyprenyl-6-methoxyphenol hydroxylase-like FAD-dependent oxidoreductase